MSDWTHGYDVSVGYGYGYCREMAPDWLDFCARLAGHAPRRRDPSTPFRYLELGAGQGMGLCLLAAANPHAEFFGVDFLPDHAAHANRVAAAAGLGNVRFSAADFVDLAAAWPDDWGQFDYVTMHGVYSWISPAVRAAVVDCLAHAVRPGGLVYNGFNTQPGWLATMPFQHITRLIKETGDQPAPAVFEQSIALFDRLRAGGADTFKFLPGLGARLDSVRTRNPDYLVHEYLHESWHPLWHSEAAKELARAGLAHVGTATVADALLPAVLPPPLRDAIVAQPDGPLRQDLQDFVTNQFFRRDLFCRGPRGLVEMQMADLAQTMIHLVAPPAPVRNLEIKATFGEIALQPPAFAAIVAALGAGPRSIGEIAALSGTDSQAMSSALQIVVLLLHARTVALGASGPASVEVAERMNRVVARGAAEGMAYDHLAAAGLGGAIAATDVDLLLLDAWLGAPETADADTLARGAAARLAARDKPVDAPQLARLASAFIDATLPKWRRLGVIA